MAYSPIENKYLSALTAMQFPDEPVEVAMPEQTAPGTQPGDVLLAAGPGAQPQAEMKPFDPTIRQRLSDFLQAGFEGMGVDRYKARQNAQSIIGGPSSNLPLSMGLADVVPFLGTAMQTEEAGIMGGEAIESAKRGDYGTAALQTGAAVLGMVPGAVGTAKAIKGMSKNMPVGLSIQAVDGIPTGQASAPAQLSRQEKAVISAGAGRKKQVRDEATTLATDMKANYAEADGWAPIEINKVEQKLDKAGKFVKVEIEPKAIAYDFHTPPADVPVEAWQATMSSRVLDEVQIIVDRAAAGDKAALDILAEASWYRTMRDRLRTEFGGIGDVFADVLGTTSAQTDVRQNFKNAVTVLTKFSRGDYDKTLAAYEARVAKGQPVDA